jgi:glycosyltransferase involved in cell wall biosynthesis
LEASVCTEANAVVAATRWHETVLKEAYPSARVQRISNGYDGDEIRSVASLAPPRTPMRFLHAGMLTQKRTATSFLEALARFLQRCPQARADVRVEFVGAREDENERAVERLGLRDVVDLHGTIAHSEVLRRERQAHVLLLIKHADARYDGLVPGKLFEYIGLGRPVLALAPPGEARALVESLRRGEAAAPDDVDAIAHKIEMLYQHHRAGTLESAYDLSPVPALERECQAGELARVLDAIAGARA